jgi:hypothetical protein
MSAIVGGTTLGGKRCLRSGVWAAAFAEMFPASGAGPFRSGAIVRRERGTPRWAWSKTVCRRSIGPAVRSKRFSRWSRARARLEQDFGAAEQDF